MLHVVLYYMKFLLGDDTMDSNLKRSIILEHYSNPVNKGLIDDGDYIPIMNLVLMKLT